jgi:hypothetical protein
MSSVSVINILKYPVRLSFAPKFQLIQPFDCLLSDAGAMYKLRDTFGSSLFGLVNSIGVLLLGWPLYLLKGASGGPVRIYPSHIIWLAPLPLQGCYWRTGTIVTYNVGAGLAGRCGLENFRAYR